MSTGIQSYDAVSLGSLPRYPGHDQGRHAIQFYQEDEALLEALDRFIGTPLGAGDPAIVIATEVHLQGLAQRLNARGISLTKAARDKRYIGLDAVETLSDIMVDGQPHKTRFSDFVAGLLARIKPVVECEKRTVTIFGEMVAVLWAAGNVEAALKLEQLWNDIAKTHSFSLLCAYPMSAFHREETSEPFLKICAEHSAIIPAEGYTGLVTYEERLRAVAHLQQRAQVLEAEIAFRQRLAEELVGNKDADELLCTVLRKVIDLTGTEGGYAGVRHPEGLVCSRYVCRDDTVPMNRCSPPGPELPGWLLLDRRPYITNCASADPHIRQEFCERYGVRSALSTPILDASGEVIGFFEIHNKLDSAPFDAKDQQLLVLIAQIASVALRKALAHEREVTLRESEERFRLFVEAVQDYAIFMLDTDGCVRSWNVGAERIKGYKASEIIGKHFSCFYPEEDLRSGKPQWELAIAAREGRLEDDGWRVRKDGSRFWSNVIITALRDKEGKLYGYGKVTRDVTEKMQATELLRSANVQLRKEMIDKTEAQRKLRDSEMSLRQLSLHLLRTQDEERRRIGRDLHDSLGQVLSVLKMKLDTLKSAPIDKRDIKQELEQCVGLAEECITEVRTLSYLLYPPMLEEMGLKSAISWYLDGFMKRSGIKTTLEIPPDFGRVPRDVEVAIFRVLQESLTNVHRHSGSPTADVHLQVKDSTVVLEVSDKGHGMPLAHLEESAEDWVGAVGVGLRGMNERLRQLGGRLQLSSTPQGTTVTGVVPIGESCSSAVT
jgi:PAS domain S-box-containing protein